MYKCGWNGCEKAYGTLNHLNAHVTMQAHGQKRTPEGNKQSLFDIICIEYLILICLATRQVSEYHPDKSEHTVIHLSLGSLVPLRHAPHPPCIQAGWRLRQRTH